MGNIFGKKEPQSRITEQDRAVLGLKRQRDQLNKHKKQKELLLEKERQVIKELLKQDKKDKARKLLKKKRYLENLLSQCDGQLDTVQQMIDSIEFAQIEVEVVNKLKFGNESLKKLNAVFSVDDVERIMDETREAVEYAAEIDSLLSGAGLTQEDEDAVQAELEALTAAEVSPSQPAAAAEGVNNLPEVPQEEVPLTEEEEPQLPDVPIAEPGEKKRISTTKKEAALASWFPAG